MRRHRGILLPQFIKIEWYAEVRRSAPRRDPILNVAPLAQGYAGDYAAIILVYPETEKSGMWYQACVIFNDEKYNPDNAPGWWLPAEKDQHVAHGKAERFRESMIRIWSGKDCSASESVRRVREQLRDEAERHGVSPRKQATKSKAKKS